MAVAVDGLAGGEVLMWWLAGVKNYQRTQHEGEVPAKLWRDSGAAARRARRQR
jgi:hypothetical protein